MKRIFLFAAIAALIATASIAQVRAERCIRQSDFFACFQPFVVDAYSTAEGANVNYRGLPGPHWLLTTTDPTRRALVVLLASRPRVTNGYIADYYGPDEGWKADLTWASLSYDQRASGYRLEVPRDFMGGGELLVYRIFPICGDAQEVNRAQ